MTDGEPKRSLDQLWASFCRRLREVSDISWEDSVVPRRLDNVIGRYFDDPIEPGVRLTIDRQDFDAYVRESNAGTPGVSTALDDLWGDVDESLETDTEGGPAVRHIGLRPTSTSLSAYFEDRW